LTMTDPAMRFVLLDWPASRGGTPLRRNASDIPL
jgi:hypothetical protein